MLKSDEIEVRKFNKNHWYNTLVYKFQFPKTTDVHCTHSWDGHDYIQCKVTFWETYENIG